MKEVTYKTTLNIPCQNNNKRKPIDRKTPFMAKPSLQISFSSPSWDRHLSPTVLLKSEYKSIRWDYSRLKHENTDKNYFQTANDSILLNMHST